NTSGATRQTLTPWHSSNSGPHSTAKRSSASCLGVTLSARGGAALVESAPTIKVLPRLPQTLSRSPHGASARAARGDARREDVIVLQPTGGPSSRKRIELRGSPGSRVLGRRGSQLCSYGLASVQAPAELLNPAMKLGWRGFS